MRWSQTLIPTMKETPEGAEIPSHVLMVRAGLIGQLMAGAYTYLPLGLRSLRKAERIVREEMDRAGAVELLMPALTPISLWERTGRVEAFGNVLIQFKVRRQNKQVHLALGPTHEEVVTDLVARISFELSPASDHAVSDSDQVSQRGAAPLRRAAHQRIPDEGCLQLRHFGRRTECQLRQDVSRPTAGSSIAAGLDYLAVEAESGPIGGDASHEFMVPCRNGEDRIVHCADCGYAANLERAETGSRRTAQPGTR